MTNPLQTVDPLAPLLLRPPGAAIPLRYRSGRLLGWDITTGENSVQIDGETFENLPISPGSYLGVVEEGDVVSLLSTTDERGASTYLIVGMAVTPPDDRLARSAQRPGYVKYERSFSELSGNTTSATFVNLANTTSASIFKVSRNTPVEVAFTGTFYGNTAGITARFGVQVDNGTDYLLGGIAQAGGSGSQRSPYSLSTIIPVTLGAGNHTFQPRWLRSAGAVAATVDLNDMFVMTVREIG